MIRFGLRIFFCIGLLLLFLVCSRADAAELSARGEMFFRLADEVAFTSNCSCLSNLHETVFCAVKPDLMNPMATGSIILIGSHSVIMLPGAVLKIENNKLIPLAGRFIFTNENEGLDPLDISGARFACRYYHGELQLEVAPEKSVYIVMQNKGEAWIKDLQRKIIEFQPGTEVEIPLFEGIKVLDRPGPRWESAPECAVVKDIAFIFADTDDSTELSGNKDDSDGLTSSDTLKLSGDLSENSDQDDDDSDKESHEAFETDK